MLILGIETSTAQVGCAVGDGLHVRASFAADRGPRHGETLAPAIVSVLRAAGVTMAELDAVAVSQGPGLFTGLRVGIATAQALGLARGIPVIGIPTLDVVAQAARLAERPIVVVTDARRGELFFAHFLPRAGRGPERDSGDRVAPPDQLVDELLARGGPVAVIGGGVARYPEIFARFTAASAPGAVHLLDGLAVVPSAGTVVDLAARRVAAAAGGALPDGPGGPLRPIYVRAPDAEAHWLERAGVVGGTAR